MVTMGVNWIDQKTMQLGRIIISFLIISFIIGYILRFISSSSILQYNLGEYSYIVIILLSGLLLIILYVYVYIRRRSRKHAQELQERSTPKAAAEALSLLDRRDKRVRTVAAAVVADGCRGAPGKVVKQSSKDVGAIVDRLVGRLTDSVDDVRSNAAASLKFFARDYPDTVIEHADAVRSALTGSDSSVQTDAAIAAGNLGAAFPDRAEQFTEPLAELCSDEDPEVRAAACVALGHFPDPDTERLRELSDDPSPLVTNAVSAARAMANGDPHAADQLFAGVAGSRATTDGEFVDSPPDLDFDDVAGMDSLKDTLRRQIIEPFAGNDVYEKYGVASDSGVLFHGPPGTGKTHISKCLAGELGCNYVSIDGGSIDRQRGDVMTQLFEEARQNQPCLIFIDEIDAIATDRSAANQRPADTKLVSQLLSELSAIDGTDDVIVIGATNAPESIDDAMLRTGRFDSKIHVPAPDAEARIAIFDQHMTAPTTSIDTDRFERETEGLVSSDVVELARRAGVKAASREQETGRESVVTETDVFDAIEAITTQQEMTGSFIQRPPAMDFSDVVGAEELKDQLRQTIVNPLTQPEFHEEYGLGVENGVLLYGPPGTGKTHVSKCLAGELGCAFISAKASDLVSKWIGQGAKNVEAMFEEARQNQPCLVFIDEIDALATDRSARQTKSERQMVNQLLAELSQLDDSGENVVVIGATNRVDEIDPAMLRTGRFSELIEVPPPDANTRAALFDSSLTAPTDGLSFEEIGDMTEGFVASDVEHAAERAARKAMQRARTGTGPEEVTQRDVIESIAEIRASLSER